MKKLSIILVLVFVSCCIFSQEIQWSTIFEDDFESYSSNQFPSTNWLPWHNCSSDPENNIVTTSQAYTGSKSLQVYGARDGGCWSATAAHLISSLPQKIQVEAYLKVSGEAGTGSYDSKGCLLSTSKSKTKINVSEFTEGQYFITFFDENENLLKSKIIIKQ